MISDHDIQFEATQSTSKGGVQIVLVQENLQRHDYSCKTISEEKRATRALESLNHGITRMQVFSNVPLISLDTGSSKLASVGSIVPTHGNVTFKP